MLILLLTVGVHAVHAVSFVPSTTQVGDPSAQDDKKTEEGTKADTSSGVNDATPITGKADAVCNRTEIRAGLDATPQKLIQPITFTAQVISISGSKDQKIKALKVECDSKSQKTHAGVQVIVGQEQQTKSLLQKLVPISFSSNKESDGVLLQKETQECKVSDKIVTFFIPSSADSVKVICGTTKSTDLNKDYIATNTGQYNTPGTSTSDDKNGNGIPDKYDQSAEEAAAAGDTSQPSYAATQSPYYNEAAYNPGSLYNPYGATDTENNFEEDDLWENDYGYGEEDNIDSSSTVDNSSLEQEYEKYVSDGSIFAELDYSSSDALSSYYEDISFVPGDTDAGALAKYSEGISAGTAGKSFNWEVLNLNGTDEELYQAYYAYVETYGGRLSFIDFLDEAFKRQSSNFAYDAGNWLDKTEEVEQEKGWLTRSWLWLTSLFKESVPTGQYYEI